MSEIDSPNHESPEQKLDTAKEKFREAVLGNDVLFGMVKKELDKHTGLTPEHELPEFRLEPWRPTRKVKGRQVLGIRITQAVSLSGEETPELTFRMGLFGHIPIVDLDISTGEAISTDELKSEGTPEEQSRAAHLFWEAYRAFLKDIGTGENGQHPEGIVIDPLFETFEPTERFQGRVLDSEL